MPFEETTRVDERAKLIRKWQSGMYTKTELSWAFEVSRPTVDKWIRRHKAEGEAGLEDRPPVAKTCPHRISEAVAAEIVAAKHRYPEWGPRKVIDWLRIEQAEEKWPAPSTAGGILESAGLVERRRKRPRSGASTKPGRIEPTESGEMMTADHKGQIRMLNGRYCYPVTINEPVSRFIYAIDGKTSTSFAEAKLTFEKVFREYGLPAFIGTDNGNPFSCSRSLGGLSRLSVWWIRLGITPVRIKKGCPWENGIHERMHKTLKKETAWPAPANMEELQRRFAKFQRRFNYERPHESLHGRRPADLLRPSGRPYPRRLRVIEYPALYETRSVRSCGQIKWKNSELFLSQALIGERVGLVEIEDGIWSLYFGPLELGRYDERTKSIS